MMSLWITILMLTRIVSSMEKEWDDFLLYDEDYDREHQRDPPWARLGLGRPPPPPLLGQNFKTCSARVKSIGNTKIRSHTKFQLKID